MSGWKGMTSIRLVDFRKPVRNYVRRILLHAAMKAIEDGDAVGFALVSWDDRGCCTISFDATNGPIVPRMVPEHVKNAIQGQIQAGDVAWRYQLGD